MLELTRNGLEVFDKNNKKLTIIAQATKGPGKEVVKIDGLEGSNGQKYVSLSTLKEGLNVITTKAREVTSSASGSTRGYILTVDETAEVAKLQARINSIIQVAKDRYVPTPKLDIDPTKMTEQERLAKVEELKKFYGL